MTIEDLRRENLIVLECISGSRAYGLATPTSDTDIKGVFVLPKKEYYGFNYIAQVNNASNDVVFYELGRFMELLSVNNPNILELLSTPETSIIYKHPAFLSIDIDKILSKMCLNTFGKFALSQVKKARGLKKKIVNPIDETRQTIEHFCYANDNNGSVPLHVFLENKGWEAANCGLVRIPHMRDMYGLYYNLNQQYQGVSKGENSNDVCLSAIPQGEKQEVLLYFNKDGYSSYCKDYRDYWDWFEKRNQERFAATERHGKNYDAKNMMHVFRLLEMAIEIAVEKKINVERSNRDFLLQIKAGAFEYDELLALANEKQIEMEQAFKNSSLNAAVDLQYIGDLTFQIRATLYGEN